MKMKTDHIYTLEQVKLRKVELKAIIHAEKQEMNDIAKEMQESLKPHNLLSTFVHGLIPDSSQSTVNGDSLESMVSLISSKNGKLNKFLRVAIEVLPVLFKVIKILKKKKG
jgi:hypothetical protein